MKLHNILIFSIIFSTIYSCNSQNQKSSMEDIYIGMTIDQFNKIIPDAKITNPGPNQVCSKEETLSNIKGEWGWHFKDSKLNWVLYDKYDENVNETNFNKYLKSSKEIISQYKTIKLFYEKTCEFLIIAGFILQNLYYQLNIIFSN